MIRDFKLEDLDRVFEIWYNSCIDTYSFISKNYWDSIKDNVYKKLMLANVLVYEEENIVKAFLLIDKGYIDELYVDENYRSKGIGKKLLDYVKSKHDELTLNIFQNNMKGISFYISNGFSIVEENIEEITKEKGYFMRWNK